MKTMINNIAMVAILMLVAMTTSNAAAQTITATMKNGTVYTYTVGSTADSVRYVGGKYGTATGEGIKIYPTGSTVSVDLLYSQMQSYTETGGNNTNANINSSYWNTKNGNMSYTPAKAGFYRLEFPRIKDDSNSSWVQKSTDDYGVTFPDISKHLLQLGPVHVLTGELINEDFLAAMALKGLHLTGFILFHGAYAGIPYLLSCHDTTSNILL